MVAWSSSDLSVANVDSDGVVTAVAPGEAVIRARSIDGSYKDTCKVTVVKNNIVSVTNPEAREVAYGTEITAKDLPETVKVQLEEEAQADVKVTWDLSSYKADKAGTYTVKGTLAESELIGNAKKVQAEVQITVLPGKYEVTVENGTGSGLYENDDVVTIKADAPEAGKEFDKWVSEDVEVKDASQAETTFVMPEKNVKVRATYKAVVDKSALNDLYEANKDKANDNYTEESWKAFTDALAGAKNVLDKEGAAQAEVDAAKDALQSAIDGLKKVPVDTELPFVDVDKDDWHYNAVYYNYFAGTMTGKDATHFAPDGEWFTDAILWAADTGVVTGYTDTGKFGPSDKINREQMAVMMYRYAKYMEYDVSKIADLSTFTDGNKVSNFAKEAMERAVGTGIISGKNEGTVLDPQGNATRAECATIIMRFMETYK